MSDCNISINPLTNEKSCVTHRNVNVYAYPDGSFDIDFGTAVARIIPKGHPSLAEQIAEIHASIFNPVTENGELVVR